MNRTQIYVTNEEQEALSRMSKKTGRSKSELIRMAIDSFIESYSPEDWKKCIQLTAGIWKNREDEFDFNEIRNSMDRV